MSWKNANRDLGAVKVGSETKLVYEWSGAEIKIYHLISSCGCTTPVFDKESQEIRAVYKAGKVPKHLKHIGRYTTKKKIRITSSKGEHELTFKAIVIE